MNERIVECPQAVVVFFFPVLLPIVHCAGSPGRQRPRRGAAAAAVTGRTATWVLNKRSPCPRAFTLCAPVDDQHDNPMAGHDDHIARRLGCRRRGRGPGPGPGPWPVAEAMVSVTGSRADSEVARANLKSRPGGTILKNRTWIGPPRGQTGDSDSETTVTARPAGAGHCDRVTGGGGRRAHPNTVAHAPETGLRTA
jgi:hypothetical protein